MKITISLIALLIITAIYQNSGNPIQVECSSDPDEYVVLKLDTEHGGYFSKFFKFTRVEFQSSGITIEQGVHTKFFASASDMNVKFSETYERGRELISVSIGKEIYKLGVISNQCSISIKRLISQ